MTPQEKQQIKARFFGMHIDVPFEHPCFSGTTPNMGCYTEIENGELHFRVRDVFCKWYSLDLAKLILRPLSDITDAEVVELAAKIGAISESDIIKVGRLICIGGIFVKIFVKYRHERPYNVVAFIFSDLEVGTMLFDGVKQSYKCSEIIDWLRFKNFALPFCGKDPIAENWAILQETTNQPQGATPEQ